MTDQPPRSIPRLALRVVGGPGTGALFNVPAGSAIVGRAPECALVVPDAGLSRQHFEVAWNGESWQIRDLDSRNGITVNGRPAGATTVWPGDEIRAGETTMRLEGAPAPLFASTTPTLSAGAPPAAPGSLLSALTSTVHQDSARRLYAVVDGAQAFDLAFAARLMGHDLYTVFSGSLGRTVAQVGPCLVVLHEPSAFLAKWVDSMGRHAGVLLEGPPDLELLHAHLRSIFVATDESGQEYFFRFYNPRVFRVFLPTCREDELREFFGPVSRWIVETEDGSGLATYALTDAGLVSAAIATAP